MRSFIKYLFPFEMVEKGSSIVIYGAGCVGWDYVAQAVKSGYCRVLCALDLNYDKKIFFLLTPVYHPDRIREIADYSKVVIALESKRAMEEAKAYLLGLGVPGHKIVAPEDRSIAKIPLPAVSGNGDCRGDKAPEAFSLGMISGVGIGDILILSTFIKQIRKSFVAPARIDFYCDNVGVLGNPPFVDRALPLNKYKPDNSYDMVINDNRYPEFIKINLEKTRRFSPALHEYLLGVMRLLNGAMKDSLDYYRYMQFALLKGRNRIEEIDIAGALDCDRNTPTYLDWDEAAFAALSRFGLEGKAYVVVAGAVNSKFAFGGGNPKLWPKGHFEALLGMIRRKYPCLVLVQVGDGGSFGKLDDVDLDLLGRTSLDELKVVVKYALLTISVEGGVLHLAHFLNGKAVGLFGPTLPERFGYDENINLRSKSVSCPVGCEWLTDSWMRGCLLADRPKCMEDLRPEFVFGHVSEFIDAQKPLRLAIERIMAAGRAGWADAAGGWLEELTNPASRVAHIGRTGDELVLPFGGRVGRITVYDRDLSLPDGSGQPINCLYAKEAAEKGAIAEYGDVYNIPARPDSCDLVSCFGLVGLSRPDLALREMFRIVRPGGKVLVYMENAAGWPAESRGRLARMLGLEALPSGGALAVVGRER